MAQDDFSLLVGAVERAESGGRRYDKAGNLLTSLKGAQGEMQVMPRTQRDPGFGVAPARQGSPEDIARVGRDYLKAMVDRYGNREHALVAYNWGPGNADKWIASGANPAKLPKETRDYVARVDRFMAQPQQAAVSRETKQQLDEAPARAMQETLERSPSAQAPVEPDVPRETKLAEMGQGYQAALALAVLADVDEEERKQRDVDDDREPSIAQKWLMEQGSRPTALAEFADVKIRSPFAEPQPVKMAEGGDVNAANSRLVSDLGDPDRWKYEAAASGPASSSSFGSILRLSQAALNNPQNTVRAGLALPVLPPNATAEQINEYNRQVSAMLGKPATVPEALMPDTSVKPPVTDFPVVDAGGGNATTPGPSSSAPGQGISNTAAAAGLAAMGVPSPAAALGITSPVGQSVVNAISPIGAIAALGLNAMGSAVAGQQADAMGAAANALGQAAIDSQNAPGIVSVSDENGNVSTVATNDSIAAVDAAVAAAAAAANPANAASDAAEAAAIGSIGSATDDGTTAGIDAAAADAGSSSSTGDGGPDGAGFNEGGEVQEPNVFKVPLYSETVSYEMYPGQQGQFDQRDAARHMLAAGTLARKYGSTAAEMLGKLHEITTSPMRYLGSKLGISEMPVDYEQDLHNNRVGIELGKRSKSQKELEDLVQQMAEQAQKSRMEGKPWIGRPERPVKRKDGSPITGERADLTRPMTYNPMIRRQGEAARRLAAMRDVNTLPDPRTYAAVSGFLGAAPDELGFSVMHPDLAGIKAAGEKGFAAGTVAQVAPMGAALRGLGSGAKTTAQQMLAGMKDLPVGMAVRQQGAPFALTRPPSNPWGAVSGAEDLAKEFAKRNVAPDEVTAYLSEIARTGDAGLDNWFTKKIGMYMRRDMGTEADPFVKAAEEGRQLHFAKKPTKTDRYPNRELFEDLEIDPVSLAYTREAEGFPRMGFAKTPYGQQVEALTDSTVWPAQMQDFLEHRAPSFMKDMPPETRLMELGKIEAIKLESLRNKMFEMRNSPEMYSAYNQPGVKVPERYRLQGSTLEGLTPAQASERVAQFETWKQEQRQRMASKAIFEDPNIDRIPTSSGGVWVNPPDLDMNPAMRQLVQDVGCDAKWCTQGEDFAIQYGSGDKRLTILLDNKARPKAQMTIDSRAVDPDDFFASMGPDERDAFMAAYPNTSRYGDFMSTPEYQQWAKNNEGRVSISEIKGFHNEVNLKNEPYLKDVQARVKQLDAQYGLTSVDNLDGIDMGRLEAFFPASLVAIRLGYANPDKYLIKALNDAALRANGGSRYISRDPAEISDVAQKAIDEVFWMKKNPPMYRDLPDVE